MLQPPAAHNSKRFAHLLAAGLAAVLTALSLVSSAQQPGLGAAMQALGGLSPDQQQAILQRVSGQGGAGSSAQGAAGGVQQNRGNQGSNGVPNSSLGSGTDQTQPRLIPVFGPEDSVLLDEDVFAADEVFLTSTTREIVPIVRVDDRVIANGVPGPITKRLLEVYRQKADQLTRRPPIPNPYPS